MTRLGAAKPPSHPLMDRLIRAQRESVLAESKPIHITCVCVICGKSDCPSLTTRPGVTPIYLAYRWS